MKDNMKDRREEFQRESGKKKPPKQKYLGAPVGWPIVFSFLSSLFLCALASILVVSMTVGRSSYMKKTVKNSGFAEKVHEKLTTDYTSYGSGAGVDGQVMLAVVSEERITEDMNACINGIYSGNTGVSNWDKVADDINEAVLAEADRLGVELTQETRDGIAELAEECRASYGRVVGLPFASQISVIVLKINRYLMLGVCILAVMSLIALILTWRLAGGRQTGLRFLAYALIASAILCAVMAFAVFPITGIGRLGINPVSFRDFIITYVEGIFTTFRVFAIIYALLSVLLLVASAFLRPAHKRSGRRRRPVTTEQETQA